MSAGEVPEHTGKERCPCSEAHAGACSSPSALSPSWVWDLKVEGEQSLSSQPAWDTGLQIPHSTQSCACSVSAKQDRHLETPSLTSRERVECLYGQNLPSLHKWLPCILGVSTYQSTYCDPVIWARSTSRFDDMVGGLPQEGSPSFVPSSRLLSARPL